MDRYTSHINSIKDKFGIMAILFMLKMDRTLNHTEYVAINNAIYNKKQSLGL